MNQHECLDAIRKLQFFAIDLNLYLDNFPNCKDAIDDYKLISSKLRKLIWDYEQSYGPLSNFGSAYIQNPDAWIDKNKISVGYEIPFTRYFYKFQPPEKSEDIADRIMAMEKDLMVSLHELFSDGGEAVE